MERAARRFDEVLYAFGEPLRAQLAALPEREKAAAQEIRLRAGRPVMLSFARDSAFLCESGALSRLPRAGLRIASRREVEECFARVCEYSVHSVQQQIREGFVMMRGGHRAGLCGTAVLSEGRLVSFKEISSLNVRIARETPGSADALVRLFADGLCPCVIAGAPGSGKTTLLRDLARQLSSGALSRPLKVAVVDERGELGAVVRGVPQNDLGPSCDVITGCPKAEGISIAVRTLAPDVVLFDEIGRRDEALAVTESLYAGVPVVTTLHAGDGPELARRLGLLGLRDGYFARYVLLRGREHPCEIAEVCGRLPPDAAV